MYLISFPLLLIPFALYNMVIFLLNMPFSDTVFTIPLWPEGRMPVTTGDLIVVIGMLLLHVEVLKAARFGAKAGMDHVLAFVLLAVMAAELALVPRAATSTLLLLTVLAFVDVITGLAVANRRPPPEAVREDGDLPPP